MQSFAWFKALEKIRSAFAYQGVYKVPNIFSDIVRSLGKKCYLSRNVVAVTNLWRHQKEMKGDQRLQRAVISSTSNPKNKVLLIYSFHNFRKLMPGVFPWLFLFVYNYLETGFLANSVLRYESNS